MSLLELPVHKPPQLCQQNLDEPHGLHTFSNNHNTKEIAPKKHHKLFGFSKCYPAPGRDENVISTGK